MSDGSIFDVGDAARIIAGFPHYFERVGTVERHDFRNGEPYLGLRLVGVTHVVWCFERWLIKVGDGAVKAAR
jgi:hypothetical protein